MVGTNPLGFLAALGALDVATRSLSQVRPTLHWTEGLAPRAVLSGPHDLDHLIGLIDDDRATWTESPVLSGSESDPNPSDLKPTPEVLHRWAAATRQVSEGSGRADADLFCGLMAEGATAGKGDGKPTHLHFTAGQQRFLSMVREIRESLVRADLDEALRGPWRHSSTLPVLGWDARGERIYALRGTNPAKEKRLGVPGADWLAFLGLRFFPVAECRGSLLTAGCEPNWKGGSLSWPLWSVPLGADVVGSLIGSVLGNARKGGAGVACWSDAERAAVGVSQVLRAPIRRADQGGYGSFGPAGRT